MKGTSWKEVLDGQIPPAMADAIAVFEGQMALKRQGKLDEKVFAEARLRMGVYGQRYDNGQRHDGQRLRALAYPDGELTKGSDTLWNAPGMQRVKITLGILSPDQLEVLGQLAEAYADGILHVTTRQDIQYHFVHIEDTPDLMRRLARVGITTQEACGNIVRNVTACAEAGVCPAEPFDVTPYALALADFLLGHDDTQDFGRKLKIAFACCERHGASLLHIHDLGLLARVRRVDGQEQQGFAVYVGGGLGSIPHQAQLLSEFVPAGDLLPLSQAISRVFARLGEKRNRNRARLKFLVADLGIDAFRNLVEAERKEMPFAGRGAVTDHELPEALEQLEPLCPSHNGQPPGPEYEMWAASNVSSQRQRGYRLVTVNLPLGDLSAAQALALADIARRYACEIRLTVEQNVALRWVRLQALPALHAALQRVGLGDPGAGSLVDITACPGTDTCKLGIAASRGLARVLREKLLAQYGELPPEVKALRIKISGCFNSCGQHHLADIGLFGNSRRRDGRTVPHFQVVLGGQSQGRAATFGLAVGAVPARAVPAVLEALTARFVEERYPDESFQVWSARRGKKQIRALLEPFAVVPPYRQDHSFYADWGDVREFSIGDMGAGECAGEVVPLFAFEVARAEGEQFDALVALEEDNPLLAAERAYRAMLLAARALIRSQHLDIGDDPDTIVAEFRRRFVDTGLFFDTYARGKFADYLFDCHQRQGRQERPARDGESARRLAEEARLFIEAAYACEARLSAPGTGL